MLDIVLYYTYRKYCLRPEFFTDIFSLVFVMWYYKSILFLSCVIGFAFFFDIVIVHSGSGICFSCVMFAC